MASILDKDPRKQPPAPNGRIVAMVETMAATINDRLDGLIEMHNNLLTDLFAHPEHAGADVAAALGESGADLLARLANIRSFVSLADPARAEKFKDAPLRTKRGEKEYDVTVSTVGDRIEVVETEVVKDQKGNGDGDGDGERRDER